MRNKYSLLAAVIMTGLLASGCANVENKFGRGIDNTLEITRWGELRRTKEQMSLFDTPDVGYTTGLVVGIDRSLARTGIGILEIVTAPFPPYHPLFTDHFSPNPVYPDNYTPGIASDPKYATDTYIGFSGGDVMPMSPGSRFKVFDTH
jgi:putative exosortase-associated protein (TIGR04073 family)